MTPLPPAAAAPKWFDTHCHVAGDDFAADRAAVLERAWQAGVCGLLAVGSDAASSKDAISLADDDARVWAAVGVHPHEAAAAAGDVEGLAPLAAHERVVAIGEIGLDRHYDLAELSVQMRVLEAQWALAHETGLPVILHVREADDELLALLRRDPLPAGGVWHCFTSSKAVARRALDAGLHLGFGGILTFRNAEAVREVAAWAPLDRLLLETDAPYLAPVPHRGHRNEPAHVAVTGERLAELRGLPAAELAEATTANARRLFLSRFHP